MSESFWPSTLPGDPIFDAIVARVARAGVDLTDRIWNMEPNTMECDTPQALRFLASAAKRAEAEWMRKAADEIERIKLTEAERSAIEFSLDRLRGTLRGNSECDHADALRGLLDRHPKRGIAGPESDAASQP